MKLKSLGIFLFLLSIIPVTAQFNQDFQKGISYLKISKIDSAVYFFEKIKNDTELSNDSIKGIYKLNFGKVLKLKQNYPEALKFYEEAEAIFNKLKLYNLLAETYLNIGEFYRAKYDLNLSLEYLNEAKKIIDNHRVSRETEAYFWNRRAAIYIEKEDNYYNSILCSQKVLNILKDKEANSLQASSLNEIGYAYENLDNPIAEKYYEQALKIYKEINDELYEANVLINIIRLYDKQNRVQITKAYVDRGLEIARKKHYNIYLKDFRLLEAKYFERTGHYKEALIAYEAFHDLEKADFINEVI